MIGGGEPAVLFSLLFLYTPSARQGIDRIWSARNGGSEMDLKNQRFSFFLL